VPGEAGANDYLRCSSGNTGSGEERVVRGELAEMQGASYAEHPG